VSSNEQYTVEVLSPPAIVRRDTTRAEQVVEEVLVLERSMVKNQFVLGAKLREIKTQDFWAAHQCLSWDEFKKKLSTTYGFDLSGKQIDNLIDLDEISERIGVTDAQKNSAKISKIRKIYELNPSSEVVDENTGDVQSMAAIMLKLVTEAPSRSLKEIKKLVDELKGEEVDEAGELVKDTVWYRKDSKGVVDQAVELVTAQAGDSFDSSGETRDISRGIAIEYLAASYLADPNNQGDELGTGGTFKDSDPEYMEIDGQRYELGDA
jgi:hypothetical protein